MKKIGIIGAGIGGLTAAWKLHKKYKVVLIEKTERVGGWIRTIDQDGFLFELGPRGFRPHGKGQATLQLAGELGLKPIVANAAAKKRYLWTGGKFQKVSLLRFAPALARELFISPGIKEETIGDFFTRRFGKRFTEHLVDPLVSGIFGGSLHNLSLQACWPHLSEWEKKYGSVTRGFLANRSRETLPPLLSFPQGMETLPHTLYERLRDKIEIKFNTETIDDCDEVISTIPNPNIPYLTLTTVNLGWFESQLPFSAFGYLIPSKEKEEILGVTFDSEIFPQFWGRCRLCVMLRGAPENPLEIALKALSKHLGITARPDAVHVQVATNAIPQYVLGSQKGPVGINETIDDVWNRCRGTRGAH